MCLEGGREGGSMPFSTVSAMLFPFLFLPAGKPSGPRTVRVVVVVGGGQGGSSLVPLFLNFLVLSSAILAT